MSFDCPMLRRRFVALPFFLALLQTAVPRTHAQIRVGAAAVNLQADGTMPLGGMLEAGYADQQEGELRAVAIAVTDQQGCTVVIVSCDVLWVPGDLVDDALQQIEKATGIPPENILVHGTHTHHAPSTAPAHAFGVSDRFRQELVRGIVLAVNQAAAKVSSHPCELFFQLGEEKTVGRNSRLLLPSGHISWLRFPRAIEQGLPTGPFDPQLPVLDFRDQAGKSLAVIYGHSTHTIGTRRGNVRSPSFYGLAAQELEEQTGGVVGFLQGASGSTHNITGVPTGEAVERFKRAVLAARKKATRRRAANVAALRRPFEFRIRKFNEAVEEEKVRSYAEATVPDAANRIREIFAGMRKILAPQQGETRKTRLQVIRIGDVAIVGVPAEYFTALGVDIKRRSPFKHTVIASLANDWIGYLPDREGYRLGGYQTWMGLHSYAEPGTGERVADAVVEMLHELASTSRRPLQRKSGQANTEPLSPQAEQATFELADHELSIELVAAEPNVVSPVDIAFDARNRMFVAEMLGYPEKPGLGRIRRLTDADGDGHYEQAVVFADGLDFPTSVLPLGGGVLVAAAPDILLLEDTDDDGRADERTVVWTGFNTGSQQLRVNGLSWGIDNWVYGANGRCDGEIIKPGDDNGRAVSIRNRDFRFSPDFKHFEAIVGRSQFGQTHDSWGRRLLSYNTIPIRHAVVPEPYASTRAELTASSVVDCLAGRESGQVYPTGPLPPQFNREPHSHYNATCGLTVFGGHGLGHGYSGDAFFCESLLGVVTRRRLIDDGPEIAGVRLDGERDFLTSTDNWFHPVNVATGPDGCLYVVDFYRQYVEHPIYVPSAQLRANTDWRRGEQHGRIWRVRTSRSGSRPDDLAVPLADASAERLVELLGHPSSWVRLTAQRLLVEQQVPASSELVREFLKASTRPMGRVHALHALAGLGSLDVATVLSSVADKHPRVREHALQLAERFLESSEKLRDAVTACSADPDFAVRMRVGLLLGEEPLAGRRDALSTLGRLVREGRLNRWVTAAALSSAQSRVGELVKDVTQDDPTWWHDPDEAQVEFLTSAGRAMAGRHQDATAQQLDELVERSVDIVAPGFIVLIGGWLEEHRARGADFRTVRDAARTMLGTDAADRLSAAAAALSRDANHDNPIRSAALAAVALGDESLAAAIYIDLVTTPVDVSLRESAAELLATLDNQGACAKVFVAWGRLPWSIRAAVIRAARGSPAARMALVEAVEGQLVQPAEVPPQVVTDLANDDEETGRRLRLAIDDSVDKDREAIVQQFAGAAQLPGDASQGAVHFVRHCSVCHTMLGVGGNIGPNLSNVARRSREALLVDILDPSRQVEPDQRAMLVMTESGSIYQGLLKAETSAGVTLQEATGTTRIIDSEEIAEIRAGEKSLMPDGLERQLDEQALADLLTFLRAPVREMMTDVALDR